MSRTATLLLALLPTLWYLADWYITVYPLEYALQRIFGLLAH